MSTEKTKYGWATCDGPHSCDYLAPAVMNILKAHQEVKTVCDLGSGNGALIAHLLRGGYLPSGVDYDAEGVELSKSQYPGVRFFNLGVQDDPALVVSEIGEVDAVVSTEVIEHLYSPHLLPKFAHALLKPKGLLIVSTPYHGYLKNLALSLVGKWDFHHTALWHGGHIKFWSRSTLANLLTSNGFNVIGFYGVGRVPYLWKSMVLVARALP